MGSLVEFRLLGPLEVIGDKGEAIVIGTGRQRALLALLILRANELVSSERLVDELWGASPPATAPKMLHNQVSALRQALGRNGRLETRGSAYRLNVGPDERDLDRFEGLVARGRAAEPEPAAECLRLALDLWRGAPFADLACEPFAQTEILRLEERRWAAFEAWVTAELTLGRHADLVAELEAAVAAQPLRERLHGALCWRSTAADARRMRWRPTAARATRWSRRSVSSRAPTCARSSTRSSTTIPRSIRSATRRSPRSRAATASRPPRSRRSSTAVTATRARLAARRRNGRRRPAPGAPRTDVPSCVPPRTISPATCSYAGRSRSPMTTCRPPAVCPYMGLSTFDAAHARYFFGRERLVAELVARLVGSPLLAVVGPSGSGKSSAVRAGLLPALASGALPGSERWSVRVIRPGEHPRAEAADLLVVDQFEEVFAVCRDAGERTAFLDALVEHDGQVVLAVRADFYGHCAAHERLARLVGAHQVLVGPMRRDELRRAIECPAERAGLRVEPALTDALIGDVLDEPGGLPLLSAALLEQWRERDGRVMRHAAYERTGGVRGAVGRMAERTYAQLSEPEQRAARRTLLRLAGDGDVRRRVPLEELDGHTHSPRSRTAGW